MISTVISITFRCKLQQTLSTLIFWWAELSRQRYIEKNKILEIRSSTLVQGVMWSHGESWRPWYCLQIDVFVVGVVVLSITCSLTDTHTQKNPRLLCEYCSILTQDTHFQRADELDATKHMLYIYQQTGIVKCNLVCKSKLLFMVNIVRTTE